MMRRSQGTLVISGCAGCPVLTVVRALADNSIVD